MVREFFSRVARTSTIILSRSKTEDFEAAIPAIEVNLASSTRRVLGELGITQFRVVLYFHDFDKDN